MPIEKALTENGRIMRIMVSDPWTFKEMWDTLKQVHHSLDGVSQKVHLLFDLTRSRRIPMDMMQMASRPDIGHPKTDQLIFLGANFATRMMIGTLARAQRADNVHFFDDESKAQALLNKLKDV